MELRPHQELAIEMLRDSLRSGNKRPILAAPCGFGKTITAASIIKGAVDKGKRVVFICDRVKLVLQSIEAFTDHGLDIGVIQADHWMTDYSKPVQIASWQSLHRRIQKFGLRAFDFDLIIVDEAHTLYKSMIEVMDSLNALPWIGLTATPYSKMLGKYYDDLIVPITTEQLMEQGYLTHTDYYGGHKVALSGVSSRAIPTGGSDYDEKSLNEAIEKDSTLVGDIVKNWVRHANGRQTIAFAPSIKHSKNLVDQFNAAGIPAEHIDGYMDHQDREDLMEAHNNGEFMILSCSTLLSVGYDSPKTSAIIDCYPTKSLIRWIQTSGRIWRTAEGKDNAVYLDHAGNIERFGCFPESVVPESLDDGEKPFNEKNQTKDKDKKEAKVKECPQCYREFVGLRCSCGYEIPITQQIETDDQELQKIAKQDNKLLTMAQKSEWYAGLLLHAKNKGYKDGWAANQYRTKFSVWPNKVDKSIQLDAVPKEVQSWITSRNIAYANRRNK